MPDTQIEIRELPARIEEVIALAQAGTEVILTEDSVARAKLVPVPQANGVQLLTVNLDHVLAVESLPKVQKDPFDRLLVAQAIIEKATLITTDPLLSNYPVPILW